ncbi:uncharacterized protein [Dermacentor andersoni]|uniref:uncharacterized protein isoform X2 n=1 Tax=Dermacentor andersoni TaxID=34620 RepID=UPI002417F283|nr:uncharacterized protein LOC129384661 isoform X2 [Dermacentor andersoni]
MALTLINKNLVLTEQQDSWVIPTRELKGYHIYYKGEGLTENPFTFNLSTSMSVGDSSAIVVFAVPENNKKFNFCFRHAIDDESVLYESTLDSSNKVTAQASTRALGTDASGRGTTGVVVTPGTHVFRVVLAKQGEIQFYLDDKPFIKPAVPKFSSLQRLEITADELTVYEAHFTNKKEIRAFIFTGNGIEVPTTPALYPSSYIEFRGRPLENKRVCHPVKSAEAL